MYILLVRRIQLYMDDELDDARSAEVARLGVSRSALVRDAVRVSLSAYFDTPADAVDELIGWLDVDPDKDIDSVVYGLESEIRRHIILDRASGARDLRHVDAVRLWRTDVGPCVLRTWSSARHGHGFDEESITGRRSGFLKDSGSPGEYRWW